MMLKTYRRNRYKKPLVKLSLYKDIVELMQHSSIPQYMQFRIFEFLDDVTQKYFHQELHDLFTNLFGKYNALPELIIAKSSLGNAAKRLDSLSLRLTHDHMSSKPYYVFEVFGKVEAEPESQEQSFEDFDDIPF